MGILTVRHLTLRALVHLSSAGYQTCDLNALQMIWSARAAWIMSGTQAGVHLHVMLGHLCEMVCAPDVTQ